MKKEPEVAKGRSAARAAMEGASREELIQAALSMLSSDSRAERIGVWLDAARDEPTKPGESGCFHGAVWDRESQTTPSEWARLSPEAPLPEELLLRPMTVEEDLEGTAATALIGPLVELRHAVWVPVEVQGQLRGVILSGSRKRRGELPESGLEATAAELALAIAHEEEQGAARRGRNDLGVVRTVLAGQAAGASVEAILGDLIASCTSSEQQAGSGATFALLGEVSALVNQGGDVAEVEFLWSSGDPSWTRIAENEPLSGVWRKAIAERHVTGSEAQISWRQGDVERVVAIPVESGGQIQGVLVAGLPKRAASLAALERLEIRAALAAPLLARRKQSAEEEGQERWRQALLASSAEATVLVDAQGRIAGMSQGAREMMQEDAASRTSILTARFEELFRARDRERLASEMHRWFSLPARTKEIPIALEAELAGGMRVRIRPTGVASGGSVAVLLESLSGETVFGQGDRAETELRSVLEWLEEGVVLFDTHENVRAINTRFEQIVGFPPEPPGKSKTLEGLIAMTAELAAEPEQFAERWRELARGVEGGMREELQMVRPSPRVLERASRPVLDAMGRQLGRVEIYRDLTAQRVFQSKLLHTEKLAALGQMVTGIAHELSNPLTTILGYAQRLLLRQDAAGRSDEARQISLEAERATGILRQLLSSARETLPEKRLVSLNQVVTRALELQRFGMAAEKIRMETDLGALLPNVRGDAGQLQQVLMNLIGNARQAIEGRGGGGTIQVRTRCYGENRVQLEVADDGPGIPRAILPRIFDPFFTTKPSGVGTGLGLAIVLSIVREHGGNVNVQSPSTGGTVFTLEFPAVVEAERDNRPAASSQQRPSYIILKSGQQHVSAARQGPTEAGTSGRVLVVEDEPTVARLIADVLEDEGFRVEVLLDGREALERATREQFDLVVCDMKMPGLDGQHFYRSLVRAGNPLQKRFLFVTGDVVAARTHEFLERNHLPHVAKPFRVEELTEKVWSVVGANGLRESPPIPQKNAARNG